MAFNRDKLKQASLDALKRRDTATVVEDKKPLRGKLSDAASEALDRRTSSYGVTKDEIQSGGAWKSGNKPVFGVMDNVGVARPSSTFPAPTRWSDAEKAAEKAIADGVVTPKEKGDVIKSTRKASEGDTAVYKGYDDKLNYFRNERNDYYKAAASGRTPANVKAYTRYDASKPVSAGNLSKSGFVLGEKIKNGSATDDDFRTYVNTEANYIQSKYDEFLGVLTLDGKKYTVTSDDEIWDSPHDYESEAQAIYGDIDKAFVKWMNGDIDNASLYSLAARKNRFDEREKVYFSDLWKDRGSVESSGTLKRKKKENSLDYGEADMRVRNLETTLGNYEKEAWNWEASNPNYKYGVISDDNPYKVYVDETRAELDEAKAVRDGYSLDSGRVEKALEYDFLASVKDIYDDYKADYDKSGKDYINDSGILHVLSDASGDLVETDEAYSNASEFVDRYAHYYDARINGPINTLRDYGTDQEKAIFVQLYKEKGEDAAVKYANDINPLFKDRVEAATAEKYKNSDDTGRFFLGLGASFWGGLGGDFAYGMEGLSRALSGDDSYHPRNTSQIIADTVASPDVEPNAAARFGMGAVRTTSNQIPSMAVGYATGGFSAAGGITGFLAKAAPSAVMFANVFGSSYSESINKGNGYWESVGYAGTVAGFETATEKIFDIPKLYGGSKVDDAITGAISRGIGKLNAGSKTKAALSFAGYMGVNALGEGFEEGVAELFSPVWGNLWLGEQNEMLTEEHWKEIGYASLLGSASALLMGGLTMPNIYSEAKGNTAVWSVLNGKAKDVSELDAVIRNKESRELFESVMGFELSDNTDVARMQVAAVSSAVSAWYSNNTGKDVRNLLETISVSDAGSVAEFVEKAADVIPEPSDEVVEAENEAVGEMTKITTVGDSGVSAVDRILDGTANSNDYQAVSKNAEARAEFTEKAGVELSAVPGEARRQMRDVVAQRNAQTPSETITAAANSAVEDTVDMVSSEPSAVEESDSKALNDDVAKNRVDVILDGYGVDSDISDVASNGSARALFTERTGIALSDNPDEAEGQIKTYIEGMDTVSPQKPDADGVALNEGIEVDKELADYGVSDRQAALERAVDGDSEIARLTERYENGEMSEAEYNEAVTRRVSEIERSISEGDGDVSEADSVPVADGVTENGGTSIMSKDDFDIVRNNSYSVTRNSARDIKANPIFAKVSAAEIRAFRAVGKALGVDVKAFDGEALGLTGTDGAYDNKTRTIYLNVTSPLKTISSAFRHEVIHYLKASSPKAYGEFAAFVIDKYKAQYGSDAFDAWLEAKRNEYEATGETLTRDDAVEEFLAQFGMDMLQQKATARDFVRHHRSAAMKVWDAIRNLINKIRRFYGMQELPTSVYDAISQLAENTSGQVQIYGDSYTRSHLQGSEELLPGELNIDALNVADEALLNAFVEVANINKSIQAKLKNAPEDVLNDDVKRAQYIEELWAEETGVEVDGDADVKFAFWGTAADGRKIYKTNYPLNTQKSVKQQDIIDLVQNVWHLKPIKLTIIKDGNPKQITVKFNPTLSSRSDLSKIAFGNRKGTGSEQRITLNLSSDLYQIAQDATYVKSKKETGKDNPAHDNVSEWHYFVTNLVYVEDDGTSIDCYMNIDVKENADGDWFYSFAIEKGTAPQTLLAAVTDKSATVPNNSISDNEPSVNTSDEKKSLAKVDNGQVDSNGAKLTEGQVEYFKDSKIRDKNGNLLVMYHGTNAEFSVFEKGTKNGWLGKGIYFSDSKKYARKNGKNIFVVYLDVKNPFLVKGNDHYALLSEAKELFPEVTEMNVAEVLKNNGYDGIVLNDWDQGTIISVFEPEQIKLTSNKNPTSSKDVKFSMSKPVEQTKDLIAVHNLNSPKLRKALELGGFPMPSIAVTRANMGHDKFGDITLVFGRDTIDPAVDSDNKLYGGDAYTPTFPAVRYEANRNKVDELSTLYDDMRKRFGADEARPLYVYSDYSNAADTLNRNGGEEGVIDYLKDDTKLMQLFLLDKTGNKVDTVMKRTEVKASDEDVKEYKFWLNELGKDFFDGLTPPTGVKYTDHARQYFEENKSTVLKTFSKMLTELYGYNAEEANNAVINSPESEFKSTLRRVYLYNKNGSVTVKEEPDYTATREQITKTAKAKGYDKWVEDTFKGIEGKKGIRNDKDPFTPSGKRRSFEDLHFDYTLDNIVRAMKQKNDKGISLLGGSIVGASAKNYKSIDAMKADSERLKQISQNEYDDIQKGFRDRFRELAVRLAGGKDSIDAGNLMAEAVAKYNTPSAIKNYIAGESRGIYNYSDDIGNELLDIVNGIANMPTGYFEAKPKRAVGFDEVKYAVVPESIDADLRNGLEAVGTKVVTYRDGDSADRLEKLNSDSGVKFSKARVEDSGHITADMNDEQRYEILKNRMLSVASVNETEYSRVLKENPRLNDTSVKKTDAKKILKKIADEFGVLGHYENADISLEFEFGSNNLGESINKQRGNYDAYAQMLSCFSDVITNAIGIEVHNRNEDGYKPDLTLKNVYVLCSAFENGSDIIPVKLSVKEFADKPNRLYVAVALESIKKDRVVSMGVQENLTHVRTSPVNISIADIFKNVNTKDVGLLKYIPDPFLDKTQIDAKNKEVQKDSVNNDIKYSKTKLDDTAKLKEKVNELKERIKLERKVTHRTILNRNQLDAFAGRILKQADSDYDRNTLVDNLQEIYSYLTTEGATVDSVFEKFRSLAEAVLSWKKQRTEADYEYKNIWDDIRGTHVRFTESQKQEIKHKYGTTAQRKFAGKIVSDNNAVGLDVWWQSWAEEYPHIFRKGVHEGDMAVELYEICEMLQEKSNVPVEYTDYELEDMAVKLAVDMYSGLDDVSPIKTAADIYDKKLNDVKAERDEAKLAVKNSTASLAALAKRNAVLNKRLADAKNQLKLTKAYSPEPGEIDALAQRIASEYNDGDNVKGIKTALTGIYRLWNEGKVTGDEYKLKQANREIASLAQDIMFGEDANVPSTEANNKAVSQFADMLSTEIAFVAEAEPTFADKAKSLLEYEREMAEIDKKEAVAKERLKAEQKAFEKAEKAKDKDERQKYVEFWNKELDKLDKQKAKSIEKAKSEVERLHQIASRKSALQDMRSTWSATKEQINEIADGLISFYNKDAKKSKVASLVEKIYKARSFAQKDSNVRDVHLKNMNNYIDELTLVLSVRNGDSASIKSEIDNILYEIGRDSHTSFDKASMRGEAITAEINALRNARNSENAEETDARINELRKEYAEVKASVASDGIKSIIENTVMWSGKSVENLINTAVRLERRLQKDIAKQKIDDIRRRGTESKERQRLLKLMQRLKRVKTKPELMAAISEIIGDYDTVAVNITGRKVAELGTIQDEFLAEQKRLIDNGEAPKIMTQALKDKLARLDNKKIGDMSIEEVRSLTEALLEIETRVKAEKKLLNDEFKQTTKEAGRQIIKELNHEKAKGVDANLAEKKKSIDDNHMEKKKGVFANLLKKKNNGKYDHLRARTFFLNLCGYNENSTLYKLFDAILEGRRNTLLYKQAQDNRLSPWTKDKEYMKTIIGKDAEGIDIGGGVKVNKASLIALYLHSMNDDNMRHIEHGGIEIPDFDLMKKGDIKEAYEKSKVDRVFLTKSEIYALCQKHLNEKDKNLANAIRVYFNEVSKKVLNEVSLKVYGYEKFNVENYFPIRIDANFLNSDGTDIFDGEGDINILESGFAQERQKGAITPMLLVDALTVFDRSVNDHALYANLAIPLRDMKAAFGVSVVSKPDDGKYRVETSVWTTLNENYGSDAETYIKDFWQNLQGKTVKELGDKRFNGAIGRLATSALYLNEQSALKQFTAYPVALAVLDTKSLGKALKDIGKIDEAKLERYNRYTPWLVHRSEGLSDATIADLRQGKKNHKWANWLQYTDVLTSKKLLKACEYYVKDNYKDIKPDTDAFYKKVAEKFNEVIEQTQQNNDVVSKTRRLNNQGSTMRMLTVFKSQNYQQLNMYIEAQGRVEAKELAYKNNKDSDAAKEAFEDAKLKRTRTVAGIQLSVAMNIAISLAMLLLRGRWDELDKDKDGEVEALEVLGNVVSRYFDEQSSMFLFGDVVSYAKDAITEGTPFNPSENPYIEPLVNTIDKSSKLVGEVEQWIKDGKFNGYELFSAVKGLSVETLKSIGVPAGNAYNNLLTTSAFGSSFLLTGGSNDFAQIIRHTIKGDLISKSGNADNYTINKDVKLALFRLHDADGKEELFDTAYGFMKFFGAEDVKIFDGLSDAYGKRAEIYGEKGKTKEQSEALAYKAMFGRFSKIAGEFNETAVTGKDKKLASEYFDGIDKHKLPETLAYASELYARTRNDRLFDLPSISATRDDESPKDGYINKDINGVTVGMKLDTKTYLDYINDIMLAENEATAEARKIDGNTSDKVDGFRKLVKDKAADITNSYLLEHGSVIVKDEEKWNIEMDDELFNTFHMSLLQLEQEEGKASVSDNQKREAILDTDATEYDKKRFYKILLGGNDEAWKKESEKITAFEKVGLGFDDYLKARIEKYGIEQKGLKPAAEANEFYSWARDNYGDEKAKVIYSTLPASFGSVIAIADLSAANYADAGLSNDSANKVLEAIGSLEPLPGKSQVSDFQKASKIISLDLSDKEKMGGLKVVLDDGAYEKVESAYKLKIGLDVYYGIAGKYDTAADNYSALDDNGKKKMKEQLKRDGYGDMTPNQVSAYLIIEQYGASLNKPQKAALWQLQNKSWKGDNNPYGENLGNAFRKNMGWDK